MRRQPEQQQAQADIPEDKAAALAAKAAAARSRKAAAGSPTGPAAPADQASGATSADAAAGPAGAGPAAPPSVATGSVATGSAGTGEQVAEIRDELREDLLARMRAALGDDLVGSEIAGGDLWVRVRAPAWRRAAEVAKSELGCDYFCFLSGLDWLPAPDMSGEKAWGAEAAPAEEGSGRPAGVAVGDSRFQVFARLYSTGGKYGLTLKADLDPDDPRAPSWVPVYRGADWHERETWEMFGFTFDGHPGLRHIYLPAEFEGYPLRKDFPLLAREVKPWPGLVDVEPLPGEPEGAEEAAE